MAYLLEKEQVCPTSPKDARSMTMVIFTLSLVDSCAGDHDISSTEEEVCSSYSYVDEKDDHGHRLSSSLDSLQYRDPALICRLPRRREKLHQGGHGLGHHLLDDHLLPLLNRELWRWSWHIF